MRRSAGRGRAADRGCARPWRRRGRSSARRQSAAAARWRAPCAIITRWHMPPENWCAYWSGAAPARECPPASASRWRASGGLGRLEPAMQDSNSRATCWPTVSSGLSAVRGVWEIIAISVPRICASPPRGNWQRSRPPSTMLPRDRRPGLRMRRRMAVVVTDLPGARFAHQTRGSRPRATSKLDVVDRLDLAVVGGEVDGEIP